MRRVSIHVREAGHLGARILAAVHVASWKEAYAGLLPKDYLDGLTVDDRIAWWEKRLADPVSARSAMLVIEDDSGKVRGFGAIWPDNSLAVDVAELPQLYLEPSAWGQGYGWSLMTSLVEQALLLNYSELILWVHPGNDRARRFYETFGWKNTLTERVETVWGLTIPEMRYQLILR